MRLDSDRIRNFRRNCNLIVLLGATATGKTALAVELAEALGGEIISADSRQIYRGLDIGTGKDLTAYRRATGDIPFHLIDILAPGEEFSVFEFQRRFFAAFAALSRRGGFPLLVGGTGLYLDSVLRSYRMPEAPCNASLRGELEQEDNVALKRRLEELNPFLHNTTDTTDRERLIRAIEIAELQRKSSLKEEERPELRPLVIGIRLERKELRRRITVRLHERFAAGMIDEVRALHARGVGWERLDALGLEYRCIALYLRGELSRSEMVQLLETRIHQFAKRQETWFRRMERQGVAIEWIDGPDPDAAFLLIERRCR